jgi:hypothetical protein
LLGTDVLAGFAVVVLATENKGDILEIVPLAVDWEIWYADVTIAEDAAELATFHE